jgi:hypothetical protein
MNSVDCVRERMEECFQEGYHEGMMQLAIKVLENDYPIEKLAQLMEIPAEKLKSEYKKSKNM